VIAGKLLPRLESVRSTGKGRWLVCCPAHDDKTPSLAIRETDDRLLIHCFAGCSPHEVVNAVGLELSDLFPEKIDTICGKSLSKPFPAADILHCLNSEVTFLIICAAALAKGQKLEERDRGRLYLSASRFRSAMEVGGTASCYINN